MAGAAYSLYLITKIEVQTKWPHRAMNLSCHLLDRYRLTVKLMAGN